MSTRITITTVFLIGLTCGVILGLWLASLWLVPQPPCADAQPKPDDGAKDGVDIALVPDDFKREGRLA